MKADHKTTRTVVVALVVLPLLSGCVTTDENGRTAIEAFSNEDEPCTGYTNVYLRQHGGGGLMMYDEGWENQCPYADGLLQVGGGGYANVTVRDATGQVVLVLEVAGAGGSQVIRTSEAGEPGNWRIETTGVTAGGTQVILTPIPAV